MSVLHLQLEGHHINCDDIPVFVEVVDEKLNVRKMTILGTADVNVEPGVYFIRAYLPSGEIVSTTTSLMENNDGNVRLVLTEPLREWLAWPHFLDRITEQQGRPALVQFASTWLRLWTYDGSQTPQTGRDLQQAPREWAVLAPSSWLEWQSSDTWVTSFELNPTPHPLHLRMLQLGGPTVPWRLVSLPPTPGKVQLLIRPAGVSTGRNGGLAVNVVSQNRKVETLLHYLASGSLEAVRWIASEVISDVEQRLKTGLPDPMDTIVTAYYLLRAGATDRLRNWLNNFTNWPDWLPDVAVIHAWQLLYESDRARHRQAREQLLQAVERGVPVYTQGLRLLIDGLELFKDDAIRHEGRDEQVEQALRNIRRYAAAVDWRQDLTTFHGVDPVTPSLEPIIGIPLWDTDELQFLLPTKATSTALEVEDLHSRIPALAYTSPGSKPIEVPQLQRESYYDVFISHSDKDREWVHSVLLPKLEYEGLRVCVDYRDFAPGVPTLINVAMALMYSLNTLLILTPNWMKSEWPIFESLLSQIPYPTVLGRRLLSTVVQPTTLPSRLRSFTCLDLTKSGVVDRQIRRLVTSLLKENPLKQIPLPQSVQPSVGAPQSWGYERGLTRVSELLTNSDPGTRLYFRALESSILDNLDHEQLYGGSEVFSSERSRIIVELNKLAMTHIGHSFIDLCLEGGSPYSTPSTTMTTPAVSTNQHETEEPGKLLPIPSVLDVGIITTLKEEFTELYNEIEKQCVPIFDSETGKYYYLFERGSTDSSRRYRCVATFVEEMGAVQAVLATQRLINKWNPRTLIVLGSAAGLDDSRIGDVVIASQVDAYVENAKAIQATNLDEFALAFSGEVYRSSSGLFNNVRSFEFVHGEIFHAWQTRCKDELQRLLPREKSEQLFARGLLRPQPQIVEGLIASAFGVGTSQTLIDQLQVKDRKYLALEMEATGFMAAVYEQVDPTQILILRAISDYVDERKGELGEIGDSTFRRYAIQNAIQLLWSFFEAGVLKSE